MLLQKLLELAKYKENQVLFPKKYPYCKYKIRPESGLNICLFDQKKGLRKRKNKKNAFWKTSSCI